ncbi:MAG: efflux RND transporter permease subunit [Planctomycetota bacterium]|nr:MAG: efflux RND transporter permease subunit [Planctomycetota bacterium]
MAPAETAALRFFRGLVRRPVGALMAVLALIGAGAIAALRLPIELIPQGFADTSISVSAPWSGANPTEVEQRVVRPLEEELRTISGIKEIRSFAEDGGGLVWLNFPGNADMDQAYAEVADRVERVRARLPRDVDRLYVQRFTAADMPVMWIGVLYPPERRAESQDLFTDVLQPRLEAVDGVASVQMEGLEPRSVRVLLDEDRVRANRVDLGQLVQRLQSDNISAPVGDLDEPGGRYILRVDGRFRSLEEIRDFPLRQGLALRDIARVVTESKEPEGLFRVNGGYGLGLAIVKETSANAFAVCSAVQRLVEESFPDDPVLGQFEYKVFWNQGEAIAFSLRDLIKNALMGGLISCAVLYLFLWRVRYTLLIAAAIPFSVVVTLIYLYFSGGSLNLFSVMGITIAIGMLVDNAVVIVENIFHHRQAGADLETACYRGPAEMVAPVVASTCTTVVVFLPLIFLSEDRNARVFAGSIGLPLCVALLASLVLAILLVPVAALHLVRSGRDTLPRIASRLPFSPVRWLGDRIRALLNWSLRQRFRAVTLVVLFLASGMLAGGNELRPDDLEGFGDQIELDFEFSANTTLAQAEEEVMAMERALLGPVRAQLHGADLGIGFGRGEGEMYLWFEDPLDEQETEKVRQLLRDHLPRSAAVEYQFEESFRRDNTRDEDWLRVRVDGPDSRVVLALVEQVRAAARSDPAFKEVAKEDEPAREVLVTLDREGLQRAGAGSMEVLGMIEWTLRGFQVSRYATPRGDIPILLEFDRLEKPDRSRLEELPVAWLESGDELPLSTFASLAAGRSPSSIYRFNGRTSGMAGLKPAEKDMRRNAAALQSLMSRIELPEGYRWSQSGGFQEFQEDMAELMSAFQLAVALVFLLMGLLFDSLILPFAVLITIPFGIIGGFWGFKLSGVPVDLLGMVGMIVLAGVVVNNGIVLVDRILNLERAGRSRHDAILQAGRDRLRPILMTALTTIAGLLPVALSKPSGQGFSFQSLAIGVSAGLSVATLFTLWTVPLFYSLLQDFSALLRRGFARAPAAAAPPAQAERS